MLKKKERKKERSLYQLNYTKNNAISSLISQIFLNSFASIISYRTHLTTVTCVHFRTTLGRFSMKRIKDKSNPPT